MFSFSLSSVRIKLNISLVFKRIQKKKSECQIIRHRVRPKSHVQMLSAHLVQSRDDFVRLKMTEVSRTISNVFYCHLKLFEIELVQYFRPHTSSSLKEQEKLSLRSFFFVFFSSSIDRILRKEDSISVLNNFFSLAFQVLLLFH